MATLHTVTCIKEQHFTKWKNKQQRNNNPAHTLCILNPPWGKLLSTNISLQIIRVRLYHRMAQKRNPIDQQQPALLFNHHVGKKWLKEIRSKVQICQPCCQVRNIIIQIYEHVVSILSLSDDEYSRHIVQFERHGALVFWCLLILTTNKHLLQEKRF